MKQKILSDETGITLVELLAAISILSIVILLAGSVHLFGQRQFIEQANSASQENDMSYALTVMTTDLRKLRPTEEEIIVTSESIEVTDRYSYKLENQNLKKESAVLVEGVNGEFTGIFNDELIEGVHIKIHNDTGVGSSKEYETTIYFRR